MLLIAMDPAAHGRGVVAEQIGDLGCRLALLGEQDHDQAAGDPVRAVQQTQQVAMVVGGAGGFGVHVGRTHTGGGLVGSVVLWKASATREATSSALSRTHGYAQNFWPPA
jgi:hypothetical protein